MKIKFAEKMLAEIGIPFRYHHFEEEEAVPPPFICYLFPESDNFHADGVTFFPQDIIEIELYTDEKDEKNEEKIEAVLTKHGLAYEKSEVWIESEKLYKVIYETED